MAIPWKEVEQKPEFQNLPQEQKFAAQQQYFDEVVAPKAGQDSDAARIQFFTQYNYSAPKEKTFIESIRESIGGEERTTEELEALPLIGDSPEMNRIFSGGAWKAGIGLLLTGDEEEQKKIVQESFPDATFRQDAKGNYIVGLPSGEFALQKPGLTAPDLARFVTQTGLFTPAGRVATGVTGAARVGQIAAQTGATSAAIEAGQAALGGDFDIENVLIDTAAAGALEAVPAILRAHKEKAGKQSQQLTREAQEAEAARVAQQLSPEAQQARQQELITGIAEEAKASRPELKQLPSDVVADPEKLAAAERLGLKEDILPSQVSRNPQYIAIEQGLASIPGSQLDAQLKETSLKVAQKADDLITEFGGSTDKAGLSERIKATVIGSIDDLDAQAEEAYSALRQQIPVRSQVDMATVKQAMEEAAADLGGAEHLDTLEKKLLTLSKNPQNYALVDKERKKIGQALRKATGPYKDEESATLKRLYGLMTEAQGETAEKMGVGALWSHAKGLVQQRKTLEEQSLLLLGKDKAGAIMPKFGRAVKKLSLGNYKEFDQAIEALPKDMRQEAVVSALNDAFTMGSRKEKQLSVPGFVDWYAGLNRNKAAKKRIEQHLPSGAGQRLDDLYKVAEGMRRASQEKITTGRIAALFDNYAEQGGMVSKIYQVGKKGALAEAATTVAGLPGAGTAAAVMGAITAKKDEPITKAADALLGSYEFQNAAKAYADVSVKAQAKQEAANKAMERSVKYQRWLDALPSEERRNVLRAGFMAYLAE